MHVHVGSTVDTFMHCNMHVLHLQCCLQGNTTMTEFLYQNGGKLDVCDMSMKRGCLHHAVLKDDAR